MTESKYNSPFKIPVSTQKAEEKVEEKQGNNIKIELDKNTIEAIKKEHNLVEETKKTGFMWKKSMIKKLRNLSTDTEIPMETYLAQWATEGLEKELKRLNKNNIK